MTLWEVQRILGHHWATTTLRYMATEQADSEHANVAASSRAAQRLVMDKGNLVKWNLRMVAAQRDLGRPTELLEAFKTVGFTPSMSKVAAMWSGTPVTVRLDDLDKICAVLNCTVGDLLQAEPLEADCGGERGTAEGRGS
nr:helix-turn-helix transcriptional regulator [Streptomyces sp. PRh5]